jgi:hypothetical protein
MPTPSSRRPPLLPREHGAYVQLGLALISGLALGHGTLQAWGQALLTCLVFLTSEPLLILGGHRGADSQSSMKARTSGWLALLSVLALLLAHAVWWRAPLEHWRTLPLPVLLASTLLALTLANREHTTQGELLAAWALSATAYPVAILGGAGPREAALLALTLGSIQSIGTTTVRAFLEALKRGGHPRIVPVLLGLAFAGLGFTTRPPFSWSFALAMVPNTGVATWMVLAPPAPRHMKRLGWILTLAATAGILPVILALR